MPKGKKKDGGDTAGPEPRGVYDDLPFAEESPAVQGARPVVRDFRPGSPELPPEETEAMSDLAPAQDATESEDAGEADPDTGREVTEDALAEASLLVQNDLKALERERDDYLDGMRRVQADFENYRKRVIQQQADHVARAAEGLVTDLLPVLDACDAAVLHGADDVAPVQTQLLDTLVKQGLERIDPGGEPFDPNFHEAVMHEPADGAADGPVVAEVLRTGYAWKGRVLRPAMVKVKG